MGRKLFKAAEAEIQKHLRTGWTATISLLPLKEAIPFYEKMGFVHSPSLDKGSGMVRQIDPERRCENLREGTNRVI